MDLGLVLGGLAVGVIVGLTGMGGGALMTPMLVFFFGVNPLTAISSDLVTTAVMKPFGGAVHLRRGTVNLRLVGWLATGSVPSAFCGVFLLRALGGKQAPEVITAALGAALVLAATAIIVKAYVSLLEHVRRDAGEPTVADVGLRDVVVRPVPTVFVGVAGGLVVGMTSVGSGSLMIVLLLVLYPVLQSSQLVGTDLVQAVPLVAAAAIGHLAFGDFQLGLSVSLVVGGVPGVLLGATVSARAPGGFIRRVLAVVLLASGLKLLDVSTPVTAGLLVAAVVLGPLAWMGIRRAHGLPALVRTGPGRAGPPPETSPIAGSDA